MPETIWQSDIEPSYSPLREWNQVTRHSTIIVRVMPMDSSNLPINLGRNERPTRRVKTAQTVRVGKNQSLQA